MMRTKRMMVVAMLAAVAASAVAAQVMIVPPCAPPPAFAHWGQRHYLAAATGIGDPLPELTLDDAVDLALAPIGSVSLAAPLGKPAGPGDHGGIVGFRAPTSGAYRIALGGRAWIDVVQRGKPLASVAHAMGTRCTGIAKMVDFRLEPGDYTIQLSAAAAPSVRIAVARLP